MPESSIALIAAKGLAKRVLGPGSYELPIVGQKLVTKDKVTLRLNLLAKFKVFDPVLAHEKVQVLRDEVEVDNLRAFFLGESIDPAGGATFCEFSTHIQGNDRQFFSRARSHSGR